MADTHGNVFAAEGCTRCPCGCKYWEKDRCIDCGRYASVVVGSTDLVSARFTSKGFFS